MKRTRTMNSELENDYAECICKEEIPAETIFVGFPGHGLVGSIAAKTMIKELDLEVVGYIRSPMIPPLSVFMEGILAYPYRIFGKEDLSIGVLIGESPAPVSAYFHIANAALDWCTKHANAKEIICLDGFPNKPSDESDMSDVYLVAEPDLKEQIKDMDLPLPQTGYIGGLAGAILNESIIREIDGYALLASTISRMPDPSAAAAVLEVVNELKDLNIDTKKLIEEGNKIKQSMKEFAAKTRKISSDVSDTGDQPSLYV